MDITKDDDKAARRALQLREAQARRRQKLASSGQVEIRVSLTKEQYEAFLRQRDKANVPIEAFAKVALIRGAAFVANSGNSRGGKVKEKGL